MTGLWICLQLQSRYQTNSTVMTFQSITHLLCLRIRLQFSCPISKLVGNNYFQMVRTEERRQEFQAGWKTMLYIRSTTWQSPMTWTALPTVGHSQKKLKLHCWINKDLLWRMKKKEAKDKHKDLCWCKDSQHLYKKKIRMQHLVQTCHQLKPHLVCLINLKSWKMKWLKFQVHTTSSYRTISILTLLHLVSLDSNNWKISIIRSVCFQKRLKAVIGNNHNQ